MNNKITKIGSAITEYILTAFDPDYLYSVFGGVIDIDDLVDQVILECVKKAFDSTEEKHSLRYYLKINGDESSDDVRMKYSRLMAIVNEAKKKEVHSKEVRIEKSIGNATIKGIAYPKDDRKIFETQILFE